MTSEPDDAPLPDSGLTRALVQQARELVMAGLPDEGIVVRLREAAEPPQLLDAARQTKRFQGFPGTRMHGLLSAAARDEPPPPVDEQQRRRDEAVRRLLLLPPADAFTLLREQVPQLADMEAQAMGQQPLPPAPFRLRVLRYLHGQQRTRVRHLIALARQVVGPDSKQTDPVLASPAVAYVVSRHLTELAREAAPQPPQPPQRARAPRPERSPRPGRHLAG